MEEQFVTYEIALKLKELGFDEECLAYYDIKMLFPVEQPLPDEFNTTKTNNIYYNNDFHYTSIKLEDDIIIAPLYQQVTDWFREKHNIHIEIELTDNTMQFYYQYCIVDSKNRECHDEDMIDQATRIYNYNEKFNTFYEVREKAILKAIELCQKEK